MTLESLLVIFVSLGGAAALVTACVNTLKQFGVLKDGQAPTAALLGNLALFVALALLKVFAPVVDIANLDATAGTIAQILGLVTGLVVQVGLSKGAHSLLRGAPVIGKSFSA